MCIYSKVYILYNSISEVTDAQNENKNKRLVLSTSISDNESAEDNLCIQSLSKYYFIENIFLNYKL